MEQVQTRACMQSATFDLLPFANWQLISGPLNHSSSDRIRRETSESFENISTFDRPASRALLPFVCRN